MNKLCRQVSIESPSQAMKDCVFNFIVPVPDTPPHGARILVVCAGACYRLCRSPSISSVSSISSDLNDLAFQMTHASIQPPAPPIQQSSSPVHSGIRDGALFPGFEVAGVIESLGTEVPSDCGFHVGQRIVLYPYEGVPSGYSELIVVPELKYLVPIPDSLPLSVGAMLPTGALLAMNAVYSAHLLLEKVLAVRGPDSTCKILIVGTGGLALWAVRIATHYFQRKSVHERVIITVASLRDEGIRLAKECGQYVNRRKISHSKTIVF
jgi:threonine dehydrogenase-like Zn-dependent dehydrogenase